jgi:phosphohistidine phosphatase
MKTLYLIRHAKSSWQDSSLSDYERPLNKRGLHDAPMMAEKIAGDFEAPEIIVNSGAKRTVETTAFFADAWKISPEKVTTNKDLYLCFVTEIQEAVELLFKKYDTVAIVAHNPSMEYFLQLNCGFKGEKYPTCGFAHIQFQNENWDLKDFIYPKMFY